METLRTPDHRFGSLPDFPFAQHYRTVTDGEAGELRVHHLDEGPEGELYDLTDDPYLFQNRWDDPACRSVRDDLVTDLLDYLPPAPTRSPSRHPHDDVPHPATPRRP